MLNQLSQYPDVLVAIVFVVGTVLGTFVGELKEEIKRELEYRRKKKCSPK